MADFNPFSGLDKSRFPKIDPASEKDRRKTPKAKVQQAVKDVDPEDEEALFLNAVGRVRPLDSSEADTMAEALFLDEMFAKDASGKSVSRKDTLNRMGLPKSKAVVGSTPEPVAETAKATKKDDAATNFAALVNMTLPSAPGDKRPALFREQLQNRRESAKERSREAVSHAQHAARDAAVARLASPEVDDPSLFFDAMTTVQPLTSRGRDVNPDMPPLAVVPLPEGNPMQDFMDGKLQFALASTDEYVEGHVVGLDLLLVSKLQTGQFSPEAHLDLHGLNAAQAFPALVGFMRMAYMKGHRTVLVVPGRGKNSPLGVGVLRERIQEWFTQEPFRRVILAFCTARSVDGGTGALYVLLRKFKKTNGKVYWERRPADPDLL